MLQTASAAPSTFSRINSIGFQPVVAQKKMIDQMNQQRAAEGKGPFKWKTIPQGVATSVWAGFIAPAVSDERIVSGPLELMYCQ
jgi:hypothetical protein